MKAMIYTQYGSPDVLHYQEVAKPAPKAHEVLIKIVAATVTTGDCEIRSSKMPRFIWLPMDVIYLPIPACPIFFKEYGFRGQATKKSSSQRPKKKAQT